MANGTFISYLRVSTDRQGKSGLGLDAQRAAVRAYLNGGAWTLDAEFIEIESGRHDDRPELARALAHAKRVSGTVVIAKLDRLSRDLHFITGLEKAGIPFVAADMPHASQFELHIRASMAQEEARLISVRTSAALQAAKARGTVLGGYRGEFAAQRAREAKAQKAQAAAERVMPAVRQAQAAGIVSLSGIARYLNNHGIKTETGKDWHAIQVSHALARLEPPKPLVGNDVEQDTPLPSGVLIVRRN